MAKVVKTTFSNSHAAVADNFGLSDSQVATVQTLNLLSQGDPGSASLYSIGVNDINTATHANETQLPNGTSSSIWVPTDLMTQGSAGDHITTALGATVT